MFASKVQTDTADQMPSLLCRLTCLDVCLHGGKLAGGIQDRSRCHEEPWTQYIYAPNKVQLRWRLAEANLDCITSPHLDVHTWKAKLRLSAKKVTDQLGVRLCIADLGVDTQESAECRHGHSDGSCKR